MFYCYRALSGVILGNVNCVLLVNANSEDTENQILVVMKDDISEQKAQKIAAEVDAELLGVTETVDRNTVAVMSIRICDLSFRKERQ